MGAFQENKMLIRTGSGPEILLPSDAAAALSATLLAGLLVVGVLLQIAKKATLLHLQVEALESGVNGLVGLNENVNQIS